MEKPKNYRLKFVKYIKKDHVDYLIRLICLEDDKINFEFLERYSVFKDLHESFKKEANSINYPKFPPKKIWWNTEEKFLNQRQTALEHYFNTILGSKEFNNLSSIKMWIEGLISKYHRTNYTTATVKPIEDKPIIPNLSRQTTNEAYPQLSSTKQGINIR